MYPQTKHGGDRGNQYTGGKTTTCRFAKSFTEDTAEKTGVSKRTVERDLQLSNLTQKAKEVAKSADIPKTDALKIARMEPEKQKAVAEKLSNGTKENTFKA